jgi:hypothetical protein
MATKEKKMKITEIDGITGAITQRDATPEESAAMNADIKFYEDARAEFENRAVAKEALLKRLGITSDEAALLLG